MMSSNDPARQECSYDHSLFRARPIVLTDELVRRFWSRIDRKSDSECWPWKGRSRSRYGYGIITSDRRVVKCNYYAHRVSWVIANGADVPPKMAVLHDCDNPACVNPAHLRLGTLKDNAYDMIKRGRGSLQNGSGPVFFGEENRAAKITEDIARAIRILSAAGYSYSRLSRMFHISSTQVGRVVRRGDWQHVADDGRAPA